MELFKFLKTLFSYNQYPSEFKFVQPDTKIKNLINFSPFRFAQVNINYNGNLTNLKVIMPYAKGFDIDARDNFSS